MKLEPLLQELKMNVRRGKIMPGFRQLYKKQKQDLLRRHEESVASRDDAQFGSIIDSSKLPEGVGFWKCTSAKHIIGYIPFIAGPNMPKLFDNDPQRAIKEGEFIWLVDLWTHGYVGALEHPYVCPAKTNGLPCPICEHLQQNRGTYSKEEYSRMKATRQTLHLIWCHDNSEEEAKGIQIWQIAHYFMEKNLKGIAEQGKGGGTIPYFDPDVGKNVGFTREGSDRKWTFLHHRFLDRNAPIPDSILNQSFALDSVIKYASYDEISDAFYGSTDSRNVDSRNADEQGYVERSFAQEPEEELDPKQEDEFGSEDCPVGGEFGVDHEQLEACDGCMNWDNCYTANQEMQEPNPEPEPKVEPESEPRHKLRTAEPKPAPIRKPKPIRRR